MTKGTALTLATIAPLLFSTSLAAGQWSGFTEASEALRTDDYSFSGSRPGQVNSNENYYDGDFADFDGDGLPDRALGSRYGLLHNTGEGLMTPFAGYTDFLLRGMPGASGWGEDAFQWADVDGDGDLDNFSGGNGEPLTLQINEEGRFRVAWQERVSALNIVNLDLEGDGDVDFAIAHAFCSDDRCGHGCPAGGECEVGTWPRAFTLLVNQGDATFERVISTARGLPEATDLIMGLAAGDVDGDGDHDLVFINGVDRRLNLARNDGSGSFTVTSIDFGVPVREIGPLSGGFHQGMNLGDIDGDGDLDIAVALDRDVGTHPSVGHALFVNDGAGGFVESSATAFVVEGFTGVLNGGNGKLVDADYDGDLDFVAYARDAGRFDFFENDGAGTMTYRADRSIDFGTGPIAIGNDTDIVDIDDDGSYDVWVGSGGDQVRILLNPYASPDGLPADMPRDPTATATSEGIELSWTAPAFAATARWYRVYRATTPDLAPADREVVGVVGNPYQDEGLSDPVLDSRVTYLDTTARPGATYFYSVAHVGTENDQSRPTTEVSAARPTTAPDSEGPAIAILSPTAQTWTAVPRVVVHYADGGSGVDADSVRVSFDQPLGGGARAAGADLVDLAYRSDGGALVIPMPQELALPNDTLVTMTVTVSDRDGNESSATERFVVRVPPTSPPTASFVATPASGEAPLPVRFDATGSRDDGGKLLAWEWYFGDGSTGRGRLAEHSYRAGGTYEVLLRVVDADGAVSFATRELVVDGEPAECTPGETRPCYGGDPASEDVGVCRGGTQSCLGGRFGACESEVRPGAEVCDNELDDDCDGTVDEGECGPPSADGGVGADGGGGVPPVTADGGCGCRTIGGSSSAPLSMLVLLGIAWRRRRRGSRLAGLSDTA